MAVPQLATGDLTSQIQELSKREVINQVEVKGLLRKIEALQKHSASDSFMLAGMLYSATGDFEKSKAMHDKSLLYPHGYVELVNYGISMQRAGRMNLARDLFLKAFNISPGSQAILEKFILVATMACNFEGFDAAVAAFNKASPGNNLENHKVMTTARGILEHLEVLSIPLEEYALVGEHIETVMIKYSVSPVRIIERVTHMGEHSHMYMEVSVPAISADQLVSLNDNLADLIISDEKISNWDKFIINFVYGSRAAAA